jgi:hypothetical protein
MRSRISQKEAETRGASSQSGVQLPLTCNLEVVFGSTARKTESRLEDCNYSHWCVES